MCARGRTDTASRRTREEVWVLLVQLQSGFLEYGLIAAMGREQHDHAKPVVDEASSDLERDVAEGLG